MPHIWDNWLQMSLEKSVAGPRHQSQADDSKYDDAEYHNNCTTVRHPMK